MADFRDDDIKHLRRCLEKVDEALPHGYPPDWLGHFQRMLIDLEAGTWYELTEKQRTWVGGVYEKLFDEPIYRNDWSAGRVARGAYGKTEVPAVLLGPLPKKPPGRR
jgi:hypothetical protein